MNTETVVGFVKVYWSTGDHVMAVHPGHGVEVPAADMLTDPVGVARTILSGVVLGGDSIVVPVDDEEERRDRREDPPAAQRVRGRG